MGLSSSSINRHLEKELQDDFPLGEILVGFENPSNICYSNVIIQSLFYCKRFRQQVLQYDKQDNLLQMTRYLFGTIMNSKQRTGVLSTNKIMKFVKQKNKIFDGNYHQDCHEFYMWFINECEEILTNKGKDKQRNWLQSIFQGKFVTCTSCQKCNTITERPEPFYNLSLDIIQNSSVGFCIRKMSQPESLTGSDQFFCDNCQSKQDALKTVYISELPQTLVIHLKRFKYEERIGSMVKIATKMPFPCEIKVQTNYKESKSKYYELTSVIVHLGQGIMYGHYIILIKIQNKWYKFDDEKIQLWPEVDLVYFFGKNNSTSNQMCAYMLYYSEKNN